MARQSGGKKMKMTQFSHSNFKGASDHITESGKLAIPDDPNTRDLFAKVVSAAYGNTGLQSYTFIENAMEVHPLIFDIDFLCKGKPQSNMFNETFWEKLAMMVMEVLSEEDRRCDFDVCVFTSHGHHSEKDQLDKIESHF